MPLWLLILITLSTPQIALAAPSSPPLTLKDLYSNPKVHNLSVEPLIRIGIVERKPRLRLQSNSPLVIRYRANGVEKESHIPAQTSISMTAQTTQPKNLQYNVLLATFPEEAIGKVQAALNLWQKRGFSNVKEYYSGVAFDSFPTGLDQRMRHLILPTTSKAEAKNLQLRLRKKYQAKTSIAPVLKNLAMGNIFIASQNGFAATAQELAEIYALNGSEPIEIFNIEYGRGYAWHGFENRTYQGKIIVSVAQNNTLNATNLLSIESLLQGILPAEMYPKAHSEALKAQAIAARSHIMAALGHKHELDPWDICAQQHCQVFSGMGVANLKSNGAIAQTRGLYLYHQGRILNALYSSTCGGYSEAAQAVWPGIAEAVLHKAQADYPIASTFASQELKSGLSESEVKAWVSNPALSYCARSKYSQAEKLRWKKHFSAKELNQLFANSRNRLGKILAVQVRERGPGGRVSSLEIQGTNASQHIDDSLQIRKRFNNLPSTAFYLQSTYNKKKEIESLEFIGAGWGHGVGLCQLGAIGRAESGQSYQEILKHYFRGAAIRRFY